MRRALAFVLVEKIFPAGEIPDEKGGLKRLIYAGR